MTNEKLTRKATIRDPKIKVKAKFDIEQLHAAQAVFKFINSFDLADIDWYEKGKKLKIKKKIVHDFKFTGLSNKDFILTNYYKEKS